VLFCVTACAKKAPKCSDGAVKKIAIEASKDVIYSKMVQTGSGIAKLSEGIKDSKDEADQKILGMLLRGYIPKLSVLKESKSPQVIEFVKEVEAKCADLKLESITTSSKDDVAQKCSCEGELVVDKDLKLKIRYQAQKTDDGKLKVEVESN
jgi:hypothetical protein